MIHCMWTHLVTSCVTLLSVSMWTHPLLSCINGWDHHYSPLELTYNQSMVTTSTVRIMVCSNACVIMAGPYLHGSVLTILCMYYRTPPSVSINVKLTVVVSFCQSLHYLYSIQSADNVEVVSSSRNTRNNDMRSEGCTTECCTVCNTLHECICMYCSYEKHHSPTTVSCMLSLALFCSTYCCPDDGSTVAMQVMVLPLSRIILNRLIRRVSPVIL